AGPRVLQPPPSALKGACSRHWPIASCGSSLLLLLNFHCSWIGYCLNCIFDLCLTFTLSLALSHFVSCRRSRQCPSPLAASFSSRLALFGAHRPSAVQSSFSSAAAVGKTLFLLA